MLINSVPRGGLMICAVCWTGAHSNTLQEILNASAGTSASR
jgi:hypothetical protein